MMTTLLALLVVGVFSLFGVLVARTYGKKPETMGDPYRTQAQQRSLADMQETQFLNNQFAQQMMGNQNAQLGSLKAISNAARQQSWIENQMAAQQMQGLGGLGRYYNLDRRQYEVPEELVQAMMMGSGQGQGQGRT